jgi:hypothetical protein
MEEKNLLMYAKNSKEEVLRTVVEGIEVEENGNDFKVRAGKERKDRLMKKQIHGRVLGDMEQIGTNDSWRWLKSGYMSKSVEGFIMAAQEQALRTRWFRAQIEKEDISPKCRLCDSEAETVRHLSAGCKKLAGGPYKRRHDRMGVRVYWELCQKYQIPCTSKWFEEIPDTVRKSKDGLFEIWWDRPIETTVMLEHNRPDVVVINHKGNEWTIVEFSVPWDKNVLLKEDEKIKRYIPLAKEIRKVHGVSTKIVPIILGSLGTVSSQLKGHLSGLGMDNILGSIQTSVIIGTHNILRKVLNMDKKKMKK